LTELPKSILKLQDIERINLRGNPLLEHGDGDNVGWMDLLEVFDDRVYLSQDIIKGLENTEIARIIAFVAMREVEKEDTLDPWGNPEAVDMVIEKAKEILCRRAERQKDKGIVGNGVIDLAASKREDIESLIDDQVKNIQQEHVERRNRSPDGGFDVMGTIFQSMLTGLGTYRLQRI